MQIEIQILLESKAVKQWNLKKKKKKKNWTELNWNKQTESWNLLKLHWTGVMELSDGFHKVWP